MTNNQQSQSDQPPSNSAVPTPAFMRFTRSSFYLAQAARIFIRDGRPQAEDLQPPSRVTDLHVESSTAGSLQVNLAWTAPGGDYTAGQALRYELRCYTNRAALNEDRFATMGLPVPSNLLPEPMPAGTLQTATIGLPWHNEIFYYGLVAFDAADNRSPVSNLVPVFVDEAPQTAANASAVDQDKTAGSLLKSSVMFQSGQDDNIVYIVAGSLTGLALIAICLGVAFVCRSRRKQLTDSSESLDYVKEFGLSGTSLLPASKYALPATYSPPLPVKSSPPSDYSQDSVFLSHREEMEAACSLYTTYQNLHLHPSNHLSPQPPASDSSSEEGAMSNSDSRTYMMDSQQRPPWVLAASRDHSLERDATMEGRSWHSESTGVTQYAQGEDATVRMGEQPGEHSDQHAWRGGHQHGGWQQLDPAAAAKAWSERHRSSASMRSADLDHVDFRDKRRRRESFV
jgi:hypothetical protein